MFPDSVHIAEVFYAGEWVFSWSRGSKWPYKPP
jgi:hypothetical protein